jgi:hypothetical protein
MLETKSPLLAKDARNGAPRILADWLKTTSIGLGGPELSNAAVIPDFLPVYFPENRKLSILIKVMLWHGSCFSLY